VTIAITLFAGVERGGLAGVLVWLMLFLWSASRHHAALVGRVHSIEHFRNVTRHTALTLPHTLSIRIDEGLTFLNARWLQEYLVEHVADQSEVRNVILICSAVHAINASGLESLEAINPSRAA
jgi:SulP family sulfate permease